MQVPYLHLLLFLLFPWGASSQQILWAKVYPMPKSDNIVCIGQDWEGNMYVGGNTRQNLTVSAVGHSILYKLTPEGDTIYSKLLGVYGTVRNITVDREGFIRIAITQQSSFSLEFNTHLLRMTPDGFVFKRDTINRYLYIDGGMVGKDSSWILVGHTPNLFTGGWDDMFFQRIRKDGTIDPTITLNPGHPQSWANRVEQLPNGKFLVSGFVGSRIATYTLDPDGSNPVYEQWYQTPNLNFMYSGYVSRINSQRYMVGGESGPCIVGQYDSLLNKYWLRKDTGSQVPPQAMTDGSVVFGYLKSSGPSNPFYRLAKDSSTIWYVSIKDSLIAVGINNAVKIFCFTYFEDQSAVLAGIVQNPATDSDPIFLRIANVGTPVTSLSKPKKGTLTNETLAPWPNPTAGTLYLKQHFNKAEIRLYNLAGREMGQYHLRFAQPIDIAGFESGVYLYRAVIDAKAYSGKIVKR